MNDHPNDQFDELMRRALAKEAGQIEPADGLHEIQARVRSQRKPVSRRPWMITVGAAVAGTAAAIGAFAVLDDNAKSADQPGVAGPATTTSAPTAPSTRLSAVPPTAKPSPTQTTDPASALPEARGTAEAEVRSKTVPIYWLGDRVGNVSGPGVRLYRTFTKVSGRPALEAVRVLTSENPADPDYYSVWAGAAVNSVTRSDGLVTVDFKALPKQRLERDVANLAVQQLVYTVQGALADDSEKVMITERGQTAPTLFGQVDTEQAFSRAQAADVQALVWIISPEQGAGTRSPVTVSGVASAFEAQVNWQVTNLKTKATLKNYTMTREGQKFSPYSFTTKLSPGPWQIEVFLISPQDGRITDTDSKTVFVK